jgi:hypothetical protein
LVPFFPFTHPHSSNTSQTRITTKYTLLTPSKIEKLTRKSAKPDPSSSAAPKPTEKETEAPAAPIATLTLKAYDSASHTTLKYQTTKAQEVGRLIQILGRLARPMAGLEDVKEDVKMVEDEKAEVNEETKAEVKVEAKAGGGKGKKKKGKK